MDDVPPWIGVALSTARFAPYLRDRDGDMNDALALYRWNIAVSEALFVPLHWVEVATRNAIHAQLSLHFSRTDWWAVAPLDQDGLRKVAGAKRGALRFGARSAPDDRIVAELNMGFWVSLLSNRYHRTLWVPCLHRVFPGRRRNLVHRDYQECRDLRNRVMHHEPVYRRDLHADHARLHRLVGELCAEALYAMAEQDRLPDVLTRYPEGKP